MGRCHFYNNPVVVLMTLFAFTVNFFIRFTTEHPSSGHIITGINGPAPTLLSQDTVLKSCPDEKWGGHKNDSCTKSITQYDVDATFNFSNITMRMVAARTDRLGSNIQRPFSLWAFATCMQYNFCIDDGAEGLARYFNFPTCSLLPIHRVSTTGFLFEDPIDQPGIYDFGIHSQFHDEKLLLKTIHGLDEKCLYPDSFRQRWASMIHSAANHKDVNSTIANELLFTEDIQTKTVAVHIRRGDIGKARGRGVWDEIYVKLIALIRNALEGLGFMPEVHVFSESYGIIDAAHNIYPNWTMYNGLVNHFHLSPEQSGNGDIATHIRDWRHFLDADILVVGGTFSHIPAFGRMSWKNNVIFFAAIVNVKWSRSIAA